MATIIEIRKIMQEFLSKEMGKDVSQTKIIKINQSGDGWLGRAEITEENKYLKKLGYPPIFDRNIYDINFDKEGKVTGFCQEDERDKEE